MGIIDIRINKIESFKVDHRLIVPGIYISRVDGDITTYDLRMKKPNTGDLLSNSEMHSFEHMFATLMRNSILCDDIIYVGPMGCQTGFYLLIRNADNNMVLNAIQSVLYRIINYDGIIFGASEIECGNYKNLDLSAAKKVASDFLNVLLSSDDCNFKYPTK